MLNKFALLLLIATVFISGCISDKDNETNTTVKPDLIPQTNLPVGFTYMGTHDAIVEIGDSLMNAVEGVYRYKEGYFRIQVIEDDKPEALIARDKLRYKDANYNPFQDVSFNGHKATQVTDYSIRDGQQKPLYTIIWVSGNNMIIVTSEESTDPQAVIALATATGY